jgi:predicted amidophosphoribosyltransferase
VRQALPSQHTESAENPDIADVEKQDLKVIVTYLMILEAVKAGGPMAACAFCNAEIPFGQSACNDCKKKYNISSYDLGSDGCGCDK